MGKKSFEEEFQSRLDGIIERGAKVGLTVTHICRDAGIARATPDRWRNSAPKTIKLVDQMDELVTAAENARESV